MGFFSKRGFPFSTQYSGELQNLLGKDATFKVKFLFVRNKKSSWKKTKKELQLAFDRLCVMHFRTEKVVYKEDTEVSDFGRSLHRT